MEKEKAKIIAQMLGNQEEKADLAKRAKESGLTVSNFLRQLAGYPLNQSFAPKGNQFAVNNKGRWTKE